MSVYAVLGAGNGGRALAAILKHMGHEVKQWSRSANALTDTGAQRSIEVTGQVTLCVSIDNVTCNMAEAVDEAEIVFLVVPANAHRDVARLLAPHIRGDQGIVLNPGRTAGVVEVRNTLLECGCHELPIILETQSLFCACRNCGPHSVNVISFKKDNNISCIPADRFHEVSGKLSAIYKSMTLVPSALHTGLENIGAILHPAPVLLNAGWIESRDIFFPHYYCGISRSVAQFLEKLDDERLRVAQQYGVQVRSVKTWHEDMYGCKGDNLFETLQKNSAYASIDAPRTLMHRYLTEDIPTGLVPISELGHAAGVKTPLMDMLIDLGTVLLGTNFREEGRNLRRLGLEGKSLDAIKAAFE